MTKKRPNRLLTDAFREIRKTMSRFLSLFLLSALAVAFLAGLRTTAPDMERTADRYFDAHNLMDFHVLSTLGLTDEDLAVLAAQPGICAAEGAYTVDALTHLPENDLSLKLLSLSPTGVNAPELLEGRLPENNRECLAEPKLMASAGLSLGDAITFDTGDGSFENALQYDTYTVVGTVNSPLYVSVQRGSSSLGAGQAAAFALLPEGAFDLDYYTDGYLLADGAAALLCYGDEYEALTDSLTDTLEPLSDARAALRYGDVVGEANEKLADAQREFDDAEAEVSEELADAERELHDARMELDDGWAEYRDGEATLSRETADAEQKIADAEAELPDAKLELDDGEAELRDGEAAYLDGQMTLNEGKADYAEGYQKWLDGKAEYAESEQKLADGQTEYDDGLRTYQDGLAALEDGAGLLSAAKRKLDSADAELDAGSAALTAGQKEYDDGFARFTPLKEGVEQLYTYILRFTSGNLDEGATLETREQLLDPQHDWSVVDGICAAMVLSGGREQLVAMLPALVDGGMLTEEEADGLVLQLDSAIAAAMGGSPAPISLLIHGVDDMVTSVETQLAAAKSQLDAGAASLSSGYAQYSAGKKAYNEAKAEFDDSLVTLNDAYAELLDAEAELSDGRKKLADGKLELSDGQRALEENALTIAAAEAALVDARRELDESWAEYRDGVLEYNDGLSALADAKQKLPAETAKAKRELADALVALEDGEAEYADGLTEYEDGKQEADEELSDARRKLNDARRDIADIEHCEWYLLDRGTNMGYVSYQQDAQRMGNLAGVFPLIFFLVAALVCLTTMTRMVEEQRVQIGGMKALGYSKGAIALKYVGYGFLASALGGLAGLAVGCFFIPWVIFTAWKILYTVGELIIPFYPAISLFSVGAAVLCVTGTAFAASFAALHAVPADLMRPRTPKPGKRVLLERIPPLWRRLSFTWKVTVRNLFRYKKRFWMTVVGIGGCTALIIAGFGLRDSIYDILDKQFDEISPYSAQVSLADDMTDDELYELSRALTADANVAAWMSARTESLTAESAARTMDATLFAVEDAAAFQDFIHLRHRKDDEPVVLPTSGAIITEKLAEMLDVGVGDAITLDGDRRVEIEIAGITENYVMHYVYLSADYYAALFGEAAAPNTVLARYADESDATADAVSSKLIALSGVSSVGRIRETRDTFTKSMESVDYAVIVIIVAAAALAFVVLYNLTNINITERMRELATLKVLGFYDGELSSYVYRENIFLTLFGVLLGLVLGKFLHQWLVLTVEIDMVMFGRAARPESYLYAVLLTLLFSFLVNLAARRRLRKIDMVESLKTVE